MAARHGENHNGQEMFSEATMNTIRSIQQKYTRPRKALLCTIHDNSSPGYEWLLLGWVAEERHMPSGRIYRYYYDPDAKFYKSRGEVIAAMGKMNINLIE